MVLPIQHLAPIESEDSLDGEGSRYFYKVRSHQGKPYNLPLEYWLKDVRCIHTHMFGLPPWATYGGLANAGSVKGDYLIGKYISSAYPNWDSDLATLRNTARAKLVSKLGEGALLAVNYAERKQSLDMMTSRLQQLGAFSLALMRKDFRGAARSLSLDPSSKRVKAISDRYKNVRSMSRAWLEFHFGWEPLVKDIYTSVEILQSPVPPVTPIKAGASRPIFGSYHQRVDYGNSTYDVYDRELEGDLQFKCGAKFRVTNQEAWLANRLGLTNPAGIAWELVPFSFVVDWFSTVGEFLNQWTDFVGLEVVDGWSAYVCKVPRSMYRQSGVRVNEEYKLQPYEKLIVLRGVYMQRFLGLPDVTLAIRRPKRASATRTATALSLLLQRMPKG